MGKDERSEAEDYPRNYDELWREHREGNRRTPTEGALHEGGRDPHGGIEAFHRREPKLVTRRKRRSLSEPTGGPVSQSVWKGSPDAPRVLPVRRERKQFHLEIEGREVKKVLGRDYTIKGRTLDVWTSLGDPEPHRIDFIPSGVTVIALDPEPPRGKRIPADARTNAYLVDKVPGKDEVRAAYLFNVGGRDKALISVPWQQIQAPGPRLQKR